MLYVLATLGAIIGPRERVGLAVLQNRFTCGDRRRRRRHATRSVAHGSSLAGGDAVPDSRLRQCPARARARFDDRRKHNLKESSLT